MNHEKHIRDTRSGFFKYKANPSGNLYGRADAWNKIVVANRSSGSKDIILSAWVDLFDQMEPPPLWGQLSACLDSLAKRLWQKRHHRLEFSLWESAFYRDVLETKKSTEFQWTLDCGVFKQADVPWEKFSAEWISQFFGGENRIRYRRIWLHNSSVALRWYGLAGVHPSQQCHGYFKPRSLQSQLLERWTVGAADRETDASG